MRIKQQPRGWGRSGAHHARLHSADVDAKDRWSRTALAWAVFRGHVSCVQALLAAKAVFNPRHQHFRDQPQSAHQRRQQNHWSSLVHLAVQGVHENGAPVAVLQTLLEANAPVNARDCYQATPLHDAAGGALLRALCRRPTADRAELQLLSLQCVRALLQTGRADLAAVDAAGYTAVQYALMAGHLEAASELWHALGQPAATLPSPPALLPHLCAPTH